MSVVALISLRPGEHFRLRSDRSGRKGMIFEAGDSLKGTVTNAHYVSGWVGKWPDHAPDDVEFWFARDRRVVRIVTQG
jgi:hypothetical protein